MATLTKALREAALGGPFAGRYNDLVTFFGTKKAAERFLVNFTEAREYAVRLDRRGERACDCSFPEQFWDGRLFLDSDDMYDAGLSRTSLPGFPRDLYVEDAEMEADISLIRVGRRRMIVLDWTWKDDEYALDAWWLEDVER